MADQNVPIGHSRITMAYTRPGDPEEMLNVFGVENAADPAATMDGVLQAYIGALQGQVATSIVLARIGLELGSLTGAPPYLSFEINPNEAGGASNYAQPPPNVAILVRKQTAIAGRQGRGRMYWPVVGDDFSNNIGTLDPTVQAGLQTAFDDFLTDLASTSCPMELLHGATQPVTAPTLVTALIVDGKVATQRRRLRP